MNFIIRKYLKVNSQLNNKVEAFYSNFMRSFNTLGIDVRGTDHWMESANFELPAIDQWLDNAKTILGGLADPKRIFLATDNQEAITKFKNYFGKDMVSTSNAMLAIKHRKNCVFSITWRTHLICLRFLWRKYAESNYENSE